jgi:hypothetical protein
MFNSIELETMFVRFPIAQRRVRRSAHTYIGSISKLGRTDTHLLNNAGTDERVEGARDDGRPGASEASVMHIFFFCKIKKVFFSLNHMHFSF